MTDIIIIGAGPCGLTAALYAARAGKSVIIFEKNAVGGQISLSDSVENYPAVEKISGGELAQRMANQINELGVNIVPDCVIKVTDKGQYKTVATKQSEYECRCVIFATGCEHRKLHVAGEEEFIGRGVSYCAVCDGNFFRNRTVAVIGGGSSAIQEALYLSNLCKTVYIIHRRGEFRADEILIDRIKKQPNIRPIMNSVVDEICGDKTVQSVVVHNVESNKSETIEINGVFAAVGLVPQNSLFDNMVPMNNAGYADCAEDCTCKNGIYAAGDCRQKSVRQLTTAVADGAIAAVNACKYIDSIEKGNNS